MRRVLIYTLLFLLLCGAGIDLAFANKFETISGGVNGMDREKIRLLKNVSMYAGAFLLLLALLAWVTRNRFEGFVGYSKGRGNTAVLKGITVLSVVGLVFIGLSFI